METLKIVSLCALLLQVSATIDHYFMDNWCGRTLHASNDQIRLQLTSSISYAPNMKCQLNIDTYGSKQMMLFFNSLDIEQSGTYYYDFLEMDDGSSRDDTYIAGGKKCGQSKPYGVYTTTGPYLTLYFQSDDSSQFGGFDMIITPYHTGHCNNDEYRCVNERCIDDVLSCTGNNPCGDWSDCQLGLSDGAIIGFIVAGIVFTLILAITIVACRRKVVVLRQASPIATVTPGYGYSQFGSEQCTTPPPPYSGAINSTPYQEHSNQKY